MPTTSQAGGDGQLVELVVTAKTTVADGIVTLTLQHPQGYRLTDWAPGAHVDVVLPDGTARQYSLCGDRWDAFSYRIAVLREPGSSGGSAFIHERLRAGDRVAIGGPRNNFRLVPSDRYLFIAGGIGITPLLPMIHQADMLGADWHLLYGGRSRETMAFRDDLAPYGERVTVTPQDSHGLLDLRAVLPPAGAETKVYCCGPGPLLDAVDRHCAGYPAGQLRTERFVPAQPQAPVRDEPFEVELRRSGQTLTVGPARSVLHAVNNAGATVLSSCRQGVCGTCETGVLHGEVDHRDSILTDAERAAGDSMLICVSRARTDRLVLDL